MKRILIASALVLAVTVSGCAFGPDKSREDAKDVTHLCQPGQTGCVDKIPPKAIAFNNHYPNVETKCDGFGHRIFTTTDEHGNGVIIYPDPTCPGYVKGEEPALVLPVK